MAKGTFKQTAGSGIAAEGLDDIIFGLRGLEQAGEVKKEFRAFHKSLSKEVELATRAEALRQKEQGFAETGWRTRKNDTHIDSPK